MEKVIVTGGMGFIGSHIVEELVNNHYEVIVIDNESTGSRKNISHLPVEVKDLDITHPETVDAIKQMKPDYIIHQAAQVSVSESIKDFLHDENINIRGSLHMLQGGIEAGVKKFIFASSAAVYGNPQYVPVDTHHRTTPESPYGLTKLTFENYLKFAQSFYGIDYCILRYSNVYGPRQNAKGEGGVIAIFSDLLSSGKSPVIFGDGEQTRDFIYVGDVANANVKAISAKPNVCVNISSNSSITINELFATMKKITNSQLEVVYEEERAGDIRHSVLCNQSAKEHLRWSPEVDVEEGLKKTIAYYQNSIHS
jgi:UDP-glucose 4-epimerase